MKRIGKLVFLILFWLMAWLLVSNANAQNLRTVIWKWQDEPGWNGEENTSGDFKAYLEKTPQNFPYKTVEGWYYTKEDGTKHFVATRKLNTVPKKYALSPCEFRVYEKKCGLNYQDMSLIALTEAQCKSMNLDEITSHIEKIKKTKEDEVEKIRQAKNKVKIGVGVNEVYNLCGYPKDINRTTTRLGISEQLVYTWPRRCEGWGGDVYFYFENGVLTGWQD